VEGIVIEEIAYSIILFSIVLNSLLIFLMERTRLADLYVKVFALLGKRFSA
jgi:hypothetical protein